MTGQHVPRLRVLLILAAVFASGLWWRLPGVAVGRADAMSAQGRSIELAMRDGRLLEALPQVRAWAQAYPDDPFPKYLEATIDQRLDRWSDAAEAWQAYLGVTGTPGVACPMVAVAYERAGDRTRALEHYRQCAIVEPDESDRLTDLADALARQGDAAEARVLYEKAAALDPENPLVAKALGGFSADRGTLR